jgi:hypothetical protein
MAILLVVGVMDLRAMATVAAAITLERLAPAGERVARAIGAVSILDTESVRIERQHSVPSFRRRRSPGLHHQQPAL